MELIPTVLSVILAISILLDLYLYRLLRRARRSPPPKMTLEAEDLAHDLTTRGFAVVKMTVIDPTNLLLRRPRG